MIYAIRSNVKNLTNRESATQLLLSELSDNLFTDLIAKFLWNISLLFVDFSFGNQNALYDNTRPAFNQSTQYEPGNVHSTNFKYCANTPILSIESYLSLWLSLDFVQNECEQNQKLPKHVEMQVFST